MQLLKEIFSYKISLSSLVLIHIILLATKSYSQKPEYAQLQQELFFLENKGQDNPDVLYRLEDGGTHLILREDGLSYFQFDIDKYGDIFAL